jgi:hypothetical protein
MKNDKVVTRTKIVGRALLAECMAMFITRIRRFGGGDVFAVSGTSPKARKAKSYCSPTTILDSEPFRPDIKSSIENG